MLRERGQKKYGFHEYYYIRKEDKIIKAKLEKNENVLIIGKPLAGKTRTIYHALTNLNEICDVIIPNPVDIRPEDLKIPLHFSFGMKMKSFLVLDDLNKFVEKRNFEYLLQEFLKTNITIIASCRSGLEYDTVCEKMDTKVSSIFGDAVELSKISKQEGKEIARRVGKTLLPTFDGNVGSIFLPLDTMKNLFRKKCSSVERSVLRSIKRLYHGGIYRQREIFSTKRIKQVCKEEEVEMREFQWRELFHKLKDKGFIEIVEKGDIWIDETYLEHVVEDDLSVLDNLDEMIDVFFDDPEALYSIGRQACNIGTVDATRAPYMKAAIRALNRAIEIENIEDFPELYGNIQNILGITYHRLAEVEDRIENCKKAIKALNRAIEIENIEDFPELYREIYINLGITYFRLGEVENREKNCNNAITACNEALKVTNPEDFPIQYAETQNILGIAYHRLAEVEDRIENCEKAITAFEKALVISKEGRYPEICQKVENNLRKCMNLQEKK